MDEQPHTPTRATHAGDAETAEEPARRELIVMRSGAHLVAVYADEADHVNERLKTTPLPFAPPAVLGVACVRGRMRTVIDPARLLDRDVHEAYEAQDAPPAFVVALRGDEQLALAVRRVEGIVEVHPDVLQTHAPADDFTRGRLQHEGEALHLLDPAKLFDAAMQGTERRRQREVPGGE